MAALGAGGILVYAESALDDIRSTVNQHAPTMPGWQVHMGSSCLGAVAFVIILYLLELLAKQSKIEAWRSSWPWLPLIGFTALATLIHVPAYAVIPACAGTSVWAYHRRRSVR